MEKHLEMHLPDEDMYPWPNEVPMVCKVMGQVPVLPIACAESQGWLRLE